jgi:hypothetical protein
MRKIEVIEFFGSKAATSRALRIHENSVNRWPDVLSDAIAFKVELVTRGALLSDETIVQRALK